MGGLKKGQKKTKKEKQKLHPSRTISQEQCSIWSWHLVHFCKMVISFHFFKILIFQVIRKGGGGREGGGGRVKGQKIIQDYIKFFNFSKFSFSCLLDRVKKQKNGPKWQSKSVSHAPYLRNHNYKIVIYGTHL